MKFLFIGDYSNFHVSLAAELRRLGHEALVVSSGSSYMDTQRDIDLQRQSGVIGAIRYIYKLFALLPQLKGYDVVQIINPNFLNLKPGKIRYFFNELRKQNRFVFMSLAGSDPYYVKACCDAKDFRYSEYRIGSELSPFAKQFPNNEKEWQTSLMMDFCEYVYDNIDGGVSCLYEYQKVGERYLSDRLAYVGIPIDVDNIKYEPMHVDDKINIVVGIKSEYREYKGTDRLLAAAQRLESAYPDKCRVSVLENLPYIEYMSRLQTSHIVLDQLYSYTPATNALGAMAMGKIVVSGAEPEYYDFIEEHENQPVVNVLPDDEDIYRKLEWLISDREQLCRMSENSRRFVEKHNSSEVVVKKYLSHINKIIGL